MKYLLLILFALNFHECFSMSKPVNSHDEAMDVIHEYSENLKKEGIMNRWYGVRCAGPDKIYDGKIHEISLGYSFDKSLKYHEARRLFYRVVDGLLKELNSKKYLNDHFFHYPITYQDLHFAIGFDWENKGHLNKDDVDMISIEENQIYYAIANYDAAVDKLNFHETYPGMGTITRNHEATRSFIRKLPETEEEASNSNAK